MATSSDPERGGRRLRAFMPELALGVKVTIAAAGMAVLLVATTAGAVFAVAEMGHDQQQITRGELSYGDEVADAALNAKGIANDERGFLLSGTRSYLTEAEQRLVLARASLSRAQRAAASGEQLSAVASAHQGFERWVSTLFDKEIAAFERGDRAEAVRLSLGETRELRKSYEASLAEAQSVGEAERVAAQRSIARESARSVEALILALLFSIAVGTVISIWLVRAIALPVSRLVSAVAALTAIDGETS